MKNTVWLAADNVLRMSLGLLVGIMVARYLGPAQFGELTFAVAFVGMFAVIAGAGIDGNVVRDLLNEPKEQNEILGTAFRIKLAGAVVAMLAALTLICLLRPGDTQMIWLVAILSSGLFFVATETVSLWFQSRVQSKYVVYAKNFAYFGGALIRIGLIIEEAPLLAFAWVALIESALASIGLIVVYYRQSGYLPVIWKATIGRAKSILKASWPLLLSSVSTMLYLRLDMIMLGEMIDSRSVGIYGAATRVSEAWYFIPMALAASLQPGLVLARQASVLQLEKKMLEIYQLMAFFSISVSLIFIFLAQPLIELLFGLEYKEAGPVLKYHIWASVAVFFGVASSQYLIIENLPKLSLYRTTIGLIINVIFNLLLIPGYGALGAAIATLISYFFATFSLWFFPQTRGQTRLMFRSLDPTKWLPAVRKAYR